MTERAIGRVRWGVLGAAKIALLKVIPAMQRGRFSEITAIASRDRARAESAAGSLGIEKGYGSYEALLGDPEIDAVYIPLPNHLHVPWTIRAAEAGKHVLVEKPIALSADEGSQLIAVRERTGVKIEEAFMVRTHPQWLAAIGLVRTGAIGELRSVMGYFSYGNTNARDIRNAPELGGGGLLDIGCYLIHTARWIVGREPSRVAGMIERDPEFGTDRLTSLILDFGSVQAIGTCSTQAVPYQRVHIFGSAGHIEVEIPFNAPPDRPCRLFVDDGASLSVPEGRRTILVDRCDQYTIQGDLLSRAILDGTEQALPLDDSVNNMRVIDAVARSAASGRWEDSVHPRPIGSLQIPNG